MNHFVVLSATTTSLFIILRLIVNIIDVIISYEKSVIKL